LPNTAYTIRLAAYAAAFGYEQLPPPAVDAAKLVLLDTIGTTLLGSQPKYRASHLTGDLAKILGGAPECTVIGRGFRTSVANAALANGTMGYAADAEGGGIGRQHLAAVAVPAVLTVGEKEHASGKAVIAALALAYDVAGRIDKAADPHTFYPHSFHPSAVFGHFAAATATAHLLRLDQQQFGNALGLAGLNAGGLMTWVNDPTENSRPYVIGMAAHAGVLAAYLAKLGMGGPPTIADLGKFTIYDAFSGDVDPAQMKELTRGLGEDFCITHHGGFKRYPCCADIHAGLAGLLKVVLEHDLAPEEIAEIVHHPHSGRAPVIDNNPLRSHCAQYILAVVAVRRAIDPDTILVDRRESDPEVRAMAERTRLIGDGERQAPEVQPGGAVLELRARDGRVFREVVPQVPRLGHDPRDRAAIEEKFFAFATTCLTLERAREVRHLVETLDELDDAARLTALLAVEEEG
jgi:2-methylcitrate dehydratase PrpD